MNYNQLPKEHARLANTFLLLSIMVYN